MDPVQSPGQVAWGDYEPMGGLCIYVFLRLFMCVFICGSVRVLVCLWLAIHVYMCQLVCLHECLVSVCVIVLVCMSVACVWEWICVSACVCVQLWEHHLW